MPRRAIYPGTFDPVTNGHKDLVRRAAGIFDEVLVAVAANPGKTPLFTHDERIDLTRRVLADIPNVKVSGYQGLTVEFMRQHDVRIVVRGLRAVSDFEFEFMSASSSIHWWWGNFGAASRGHKPDADPQGRHCSAVAGSGGCPCSRDHAAARGRLPRRCRARGRTAA
jgi:cytidyltransferase-like protein